MNSISTVVSLLLSTALLLVGHGLQLTLLPLRAGSFGMPELLIGLSASCYFLGFIIGCLLIPRIIARVGHIRAFAVLSAVMVSSILCLEMFDAWPLWLLLRLLTGLAMSGLYTVIESWLNTQSTAQSRGKVLSIYTFITLISMMVGQFLINVGPIESATPFTVTALFLALAILPVGMTRRIAPTPVEITQYRFPKLYRLSHSAFAGALLSGLVTGSFWSLGALFASQYSRNPFDITWFMSAAIIGGALIQYPVGWLSDRVDRRKVLIGLCFGGALASTAVSLSTGQRWHLAAVFLFGASVMPLYAMALATAADVSASEEFVEIGTSVLLLNALGAVVAPVPLGQLMTRMGPVSLFWAFAAACLLVALYLCVQLRIPRAVPVAQQTPFEVAAADTSPTGFELDPRAPATEEPQAHVVEAQ
jgi:MFS family permease